MTNPAQLQEISGIQNRMKKSFSVIAACVVLAAFAAAAQAHIKVIKISITNPSALQRNAEDIVLSIPTLKKIAPDFAPASVIVTTSDAATIAEDAATLETQELPSQVDDLDGDHKADELAFQIDLKPHQTRIVSICYGDEPAILRLRSDYPKRTDAAFNLKFDGLAWESERNAWRIYFDARNAIDLYGKRRLTLQLKLYGTPDYAYHDESSEGRDIYDVADALGIGAVGAWVDGKVVKISDVKDRKWRIISAGPVRTLAAKGIEGFSEMERVIEERAPLGRNIDAQDVGNAALYLLSPLGSMVTGTTLYVDSGYHAMGM